MDYVSLDLTYEELKERLLPIAGNNTVTVETVYNNGTPKAKLIKVNNDTELSDTSTNPVANYVIKQELDKKCTSREAFWRAYGGLFKNQKEGNPIQTKEISDEAYEIILNTDTELSDTSTNPVANSTIKAELDKKVDVSEYNKKYEVIETVTTEEEISVFSRSQEPDGTAYKFDSMRVLLEIASADSESSILVRMQQNANSKWVYWYQNASGISTSKKYLSCEGYKNCGIWDNETLYGGGEYLVPNKVGQVPAFWGKFSEESVPQICYLYIAGKLPIGTKITILGVRA